MAVRIIQWATGAVGLPQLRAVIDTPGYELSGLSQAVLAGQMDRAQRILDGLEAEGEAAVLVFNTLAGDVRALRASSGELVWSARTGYPGAPAYLEFHHREQSQRVLAVSRAPYDEAAALAQARAHAADFVERLAGRGEATVVATYDFELFGLEPRYRLKQYLN